MNIPVFSGLLSAWRQSQPVRRPRGEYFLISLIFFLALIVSAALSVSLFKGAPIGMVGGPGLPHYGTPTGLAAVSLAYGLAVFYALSALLCLYILFTVTVQRFLHLNLAVKQAFIASVAILTPGIGQLLMLLLWVYPGKA